MNRIAKCDLYRIWLDSSAPGLHIVESARGQCLTRVQMGGSKFELINILYIFWVYRVIYECQMYFPFVSRIYLLSIHIRVFVCFVHVFPNFYFTCQFARRHSMVILVVHYNCCVYLLCFEDSHYSFAGAWWSAIVAVEIRMGIPMYRNNGTGFNGIEARGWTFFFC